MSNVYSQQNNYFTNNEVDSIYSKLIHRKQLIKQVNSLNIALKFSDSIEVAYKNKISFLNEKTINLTQVNTSQLEIIKNKDVQIKLQKKIHRRKTFFNYLKGVVIGGGIATFLLLK